MPRRWCSWPGCNELVTVPAKRCDIHQAQADSRDTQRRARAAAGRPSGTARGYGVVYQRRAKALLAQARRGGATCGIGHHPLLEGMQLVVHHPDGNPAAADPATCRLVVACKPCNDGYRQ